MNVQNWLIVGIMAALVGMMGAEVLAVKQIETKLDRIAGFVSDLAGEKEPRN